MVNDSIEVDEATYPILIEERSVAEDSMGFGRWNGAPAVKGSYRSLTGDMTVYFFGDGGTFPAKGVLGRQAGRGLRHLEAAQEWQAGALARFLTDCTTARRRRSHYRSCAGGGYGDPRTPRARARAGRRQPPLAHAGDRKESLRRRREASCQWRRLRARRSRHGKAALDGAQNSGTRKAAKPARKAATRATKKTTPKPAKKSA